MSSSLQLSTTVGSMASSSSASAPVGIAPTPAVRLEVGNFNLWKGILLPNLAGAGLHRHLDATVTAPAKTITTGDGDKATTVANPEYERWWIQDQRVIGLLLSSMEPDIANQLIGRVTAASVWKSVHDLYGAQSRANVRHIRRQLVSTRKEDLSAAAYMQKMKALADAMAVAGVPITDDELIDYIVIRLGSTYNAVTAPLTLGNSTEAISYATFYSNVLSFESLQAQQAHAEGWTSSVNTAMRPNPAFQGGGSSTRPFGNDGQQGQPRGGGSRNGGYGRNDSGGYGRNDGGNFGGRNDGRTGGGNGGGNGGGWNDGRNNNNRNGGGNGQ
nr:uncharacterized protein LOC127320990 [Lolium perenne]